MKEDLIAAAWIHACKTATVQVDIPAGEGEMAEEIIAKKNAI